MFKRISILVLILFLGSCSTEVSRPEVLEADIVQPKMYTIATWNLEHLREENGLGKKPRTDDDYEKLARIAKRGSADIIALQEVENAAAVARVFDPEQYQFFISSREISGDMPIRTGFAVRKNIKVWDNGDYGRLDVTGRGLLRYGKDITVELSGHKIRLLSVHLKSGCFDNVNEWQQSDCETRLAQTQPLEDWIDKRAIESESFIVLGDFNRRYDSDNETEWGLLDDGEPKGAGLIRVTEGEPQWCHFKKWPKFIDHILLSETSARWRVPETFFEISYWNKEVGSDGKKPSDHCMLSVRLSLGEKRANDEENAVYREVAGTFVNGFWGFDVQILSWTIYMEGRYTNEVWDKIRSEHPFITKSMVENYRKANGTIQCMEQSNIGEVLPVFGEKECFSGKNVSRDSVTKDGAAAFFSRVGFDDGGNKAMVFVGGNCGVMCGQGFRIHLEKDERGWHVVDIQPTWIN